MGYTMNSNKFLSADKISDDGKREINTDARTKRIEIRPILIPILMLLICLVPYQGGGFVSLTKVVTGAIVVLLSLPAVVASLFYKNKVKGQLLLLLFLSMTLLNFLVGMANNVAFSWWIKLAFGSYIFTAMIFTVTYYARTPNQRRNLWMWLVIMLTVASFFDYLFAATTTGIAEAWEERNIGGSPWPTVAAMLLLPALGKILFKSLWLSAGFFANIMLMILSSSRINFMILGMGVLYTIFFVAKGFSKRFFSVFFFLVLGLIVVSTPIYNRMYQRFSVATQDDSVINRLDQAVSAAYNVSGSIPALLLGKGFGVRWKSYPGAFFGRSPGGSGPSRTNLDPPHNDYACRLLYCGLIGLILQLLLFFTLGYVFWSAIRRFARDNVDRYTQIRIHGALLVLLYMAAFGFTGGNFYYWTNNIFQGCVLGIGLVDATEILSPTKKVP